MSDRHWIMAWRQLKPLHTAKSRTYGTGRDPLRNFTALAELIGDDPERYALQRIIEKASRALNMLDAGEAEMVLEYPDIASLALCAEALRRRRFEAEETKETGSAETAAVPTQETPAGCQGPDPCACSQTYYSEATRYSAPQNLS